MRRPFSSDRKSPEMDEFLFAIFRTMASDPRKWANMEPVSPAQVERVLKIPGIREGLIDIGVIDEDAPPSAPQEAVKLFLDEETDRGNPDFRVSTKDLYSEYQRWCRHREILPVGKTEFGRLLRKVLGDIEITRPWRYRGRNRPQLYVGLRLRPPQRHS